MDLDEVIKLEQVVSGDPTQPHFSHPLFRVNDLLIPRGLTKGDLLPQSLVVTDSHDDTWEEPWSQRINETVIRVHCGVWRLANHVAWERDVEGVLSL